MVLCPWVYRYLDIFSANPIYVLLIKVLLRSKKSLYNERLKSTFNG